MANYFLDGTNLSDSTSVYTDAGLTTCAPDGFYSNGTIVREQVGCELLPAQICPTCPTPTEPCGGDINASGNQGIYLLNVNTGDTPTDVGAIIVKFDPYGVPDGVRATYNGVVFNKLSSPVDGYHGSTNANNPTFIGNTGQDCGISGSSYTLNEYQYSGGSFVSTGNTQNITIDAGDVSLDTSPGNCVMVIPKTLPTPSDIALEFIGPCGGTAFVISVSCPEMLIGFNSSTNASSNADLACETIIDTVYYNAPVTGTAGVPAIYDWVFQDAYGENTLAEGFYNTDSGWIQVDVNGIIIGLGNCTVAINATFDVDGGTPTYSPQTGPSPLSVTSPGTPTKSGFTFDGWLPSLPTIITNNTIFTVQWVAEPVNCVEYTVGTTSSSGLSYSYTDCDGFAAGGVIGGASGQDQETFCAQEGSVSADGGINVVLEGDCPFSYDVTATFDVNGGNESYTDQVGPSPLSVTNPGTPTRSGFIFDGWSPNLPTDITSNTTFTAQWTAESGIVYDSVIHLDDCNQQTGEAKTIVPVDEVEVTVGNQLYGNGGGVIAPLPSRNYRMSFGLTDGEIYNTSSILISTFIISVDGSGVITSKNQC